MQRSRGGLMCVFNMPDDKGECICSGTLNTRSTGFAVGLQSTATSSPVLSPCPSSCPSRLGPTLHSPCEHLFHYCPWHCGRLDSYLPSVGPRSACAISHSSLIESQVLEVRWYTDHTVSLPIDKDCSRRIGPPQSRWGHVDKGVTSGLGCYCVAGTLLGLRDNGYPPLPIRLCSYPITQYPLIQLCSVGNLLRLNQGKVGQGVAAFHRFIHKT